MRVLTGEQGFMWEVWSEIFAHKRYTASACYVCQKTFAEEDAVVKFFLVYSAKKPQV